MHRRSLLTLCVVLLTLAVAAWSAQAADLRPSSSCLPDSTVGMVRMPDPPAFMEALRARTKLGSVVLSKERFAKILEIIRDETGEEWQKMTEGLAKFNLTTDDLLGLFAGDVGYAVILHAPEQVPLGVAWLEPGEDLGGRIVDAIKKGLEEQEDDGPKIERFDTEIAGHEVLHLTCPVVTREAKFPERMIDEDGNVKKLDPDEIKFESHVTGKFEVLIARIGGRLLICHTYPPARDRRAFDEDGEEAEMPAEDDGADRLELCKAEFGRFLEAHASGGGAGLSIFEVPGVAAAMPEGIPWIELFFDPRPLLKMVGDGEEHATARRIIEAIGVDQAGPVVARAALDGNVLRQGMFISLPGPRHGLMTLFDQPAIEPEPPTWVPAEMMQYSHFSFDLAKAYTQIKELVLAEVGDRAKGTFAFVEMQVQNTLQTDLPTLLGSIGDRHSYVTLPPVFGEEANTPPQQRMAFFWPVKDEALWNRVLQTVSALAQQEIVEEQGFRGLRFPDGGPLPGGAFVGQGHLVVGAGKDIVEKLLVALRNPPTDSLRSSPTMARAREILPLQAGMAFSLNNTNEYLKSFHRSLSFSMKQIEDTMEDLDEEAPEKEKRRRVMKRVTEVMPTEKELEGTFGVSVGYGLVDDNGITSRQAAELPPAP